MKILKSNEFNEKLNIKPVNFDAIKPARFEKIKNPAYTDLLVPGNVAVTTFTTNERSRKIVWLCAEEELLKTVGINRGGTGPVLIRLVNNKTSWNVAEGWENRFPDHRMFGSNMRVLDIYRTDIRTDSIESFDDFDRVYTDTATALEKQTNEKYLINEKLGIKPIDIAKLPTYRFAPVTRDELMEIINYKVGECGYSCDLNDIDVSNIDDMHALFYGWEFSCDISKWNVSNVKNMEKMFMCSDFDGDISKWDVSNVENMREMFHDAVFNGDIADWDVSNVETMNGMFRYAAFDGDLSKWRLKPNCVTSWMFENSKLRNKPERWPKGAII